MKLALPIALIAVTGCASMSPGPTIAAMQVDRRCHAWLDNGIGHASARVEQEHAVLYGGLGETESASFRPGGNDIVVRDTPVGMYAERVLTLTGASAPTSIGVQSATISSAGGQVVVQYNRACSDREAALGVTSLFVAIANQHWH